MCGRRHPSLEARALTAIAPTMPIVMFVGDPIGSGLIKSLARPGGNVTGVSVLNVDLSGKRLELLKQAVPKARRIAVLWNAATPQSADALRLTEADSQPLGLEILALGVRAPGDVPSALNEATKNNSDALLVIPDGMTFAVRRTVIDFVERKRQGIRSAKRPPTVGSRRMGPTCVNCIAGLRSTSTGFSRVPSPLISLWSNPPDLS